MNIADFKDILIIAVSTNVGIIAGGTAGSIMSANRQRLEKKGYPEPYIIFQQKFTKQFGWQFLTFIITVQVLLSVILISSIGQLIIRDYLELIIMPTLILSLPFALFKTSQANKEYKRLAEENGLDIAVDFGFIQLKKMFRPQLEIVSTILIFSYLLINLSLRDSMIITLYVLLLWFFAGVVRFSKYSIKPLLKDQYLTMGKASIAFQAILIFLLILPRGIDNWPDSGAAGRIILLIVSCGLTAKLVYYVFVYRTFSKEVRALI